LERRRRIGRAVGHGAIGGPIEADTSAEAGSSKDDRPQARHFDRIITKHVTDEQPGATLAVATEVRPAGGLDDGGLKRSVSENPAGRASPQPGEAREPAHR